MTFDTTEIKGHFHFGLTRQKKNIAFVLKARLNIKTPSKA
jgi:hypothetical protein